MMDGEISKKSAEAFIKALNDWPQGKTPGWPAIDLTSGGNNMNRYEVLDRIDKLREEHDELQGRIGRLEMFIKHKIFADEVDYDQKTLLLQQLEAMIAYKVSLDSRIQLMLSEIKEK